MKPIQYVRQQMLRSLVDFLVAPVPSGEDVDPEPATDDLARVLQTGDILLVRGRTRFARFVCALTGSRWSHVAICVRGEDGDGEAVWAIEADIEAGVRRIDLDGLGARDLLVIRPAGLTLAARLDLARYLIGRLGHGYDVDHVLELTWLLVARRIGTSRLGSARLGAGRWKLRPADPARAICSTLVAHALAAAGVALRVDAPLAASGETLSLDHLVPGDFERASGMATVFDSRLPPAA
ncbi:MAG: YiiX/YebB-like N1pC/P60 family cysteine hydrolase [Lautropia sp.]